MVKELEYTKFVDFRKLDVNSVTVYPGRAEVRRSFDVELKEGENIIGLLYMPNDYADNSLRIQGTGGKVVMKDISVVYNSPLLEKHHDETLEKIKEKVEQIKAKINSCDNEIGGIKAFIKNHSPEFTTPEQAISNFKACRTRLEELHKEKLDFEKQKDLFEADLNDYQIRAGDDSKLKTVATIRCHSNEAQKVCYKVSYVVFGPTWEAKYFARLDTKESKDSVQWEYMALITQYSGESWNNVQATLDTSQMSLNENIPRLHPWKLRIIRPVAKRSGGPMLFGAAAPPPPPAAAGAITRQALANVEVETDGIQAVSFATSTAVSASSFEIDGTLSIPGDGTEISVPITFLTLESSLRHVVIPRLDLRCHMKAILKNSSDFTFLEGQVLIYVDGNFVATHQLKNVSANEKFDLPLGVDPSVKVKQHPLIRKEADAGSVLTNKTRTYDLQYRYEITNYGSTDLNNVIVYEQTPVSEDSSIEVSITEPKFNNPPKGCTVSWTSDEETEGVNDGGGNETEGIFRFIISTLPVGKPQKIESRFMVTTPPKARISGL